MSTAQTPAAEEHSGDRAAASPAAESVARDFFDAFDRKDVERVMSLVSDDIVEDVPGVGIIEGAEEERAFLNSLFSSFPDMATEMTRVTAAGNVVAIEWSRRGTFTGAPWQGLPASGRSFSTRGAAFLEVNGDRVTRVTIYSDSATLARDLGVLPAEGSGAERLALAMFRARVRTRRALGALLPVGKAGN
jgi:steroid delta-isomerase-like uncharacterized protein